MPDEQRTRAAVAAAGSPSTRQAGGVPHAAGDSRRAIPSAPASLDRRLRKARCSVGFSFFLSGVAISTWTARTPAIKGTLRLSDGALSVGLLAIAAGAVVAMQVVGHLVDRFGSARVVTPAAAVAALALIGPGYAANLPVLVGALFVFGAGHGMVDVAMNSHAMEVQRAYQRPIMASFHAVFSLGGLAGSLAGGLAARAGASAAITFVAVGVPLAAVALPLGRWLLPSAHPATRRGSDPLSVTPRAFARRWPAHLVLLGVLCLCCLVGEGAMADWSSVYLHDALHSTPGLAPMGYAVFSVTMAAGRLLGDRLTRRVGPVRLVRCSGLLAAAGLGAGLLASQPIAAIAGFGAFGAGLSVIVPQVFSAAGSSDPKRAGRNLAQVASIGYLGFLAGPAAIGSVAQILGLPAALWIPTVLALLVAAAATAVRPRPAATAP